MSPFREKKDKLLIPGIKVDWDFAIDELNKCIDSNKHSWEVKMDILKMIIEVERLKRSDDMDRYFEILDNNYELIKGVS